MCFVYAVERGPGPSDATETFTVVIIVGLLMMHTGFALWFLDSSSKLHTNLCLACAGAIIL